MAENVATEFPSNSTKTYSFMRKYATANGPVPATGIEKHLEPHSRAFGDNLTNMGVQRCAAKPTIVQPQFDDVFETPAAARAPRQAEDPASSGKMLAKQLGEVAKKLATPIEHEARGSRRCSMLPGELELHTSILDLNGFDAQGERRRRSLSTPLIVNGKCQVPVPLNAVSSVPSKTDAEVAELRSQRDEMMSILEGYQGTIAKMSDDYSADACAWTSENKLLKTEVARLRRERQQIHEQFTVLYENKYVPLKDHAKKLERMAADAVRADVLVAEADALKGELRAAKDKYEQAIHERERALMEVAKKQQQINKLSEGLREKSSLVEEYKAVNERFYEIKLGYKAKIESLQRQLRERDGTLL